MRITSLLAVVLVVVAPASGRGQEARSSLTLEECLQLAASRNLRVQESSWRTWEAEAAVIEARAASYPHVDVAGEYLRIQDPPRLGTAEQQLEIGRSDALLVHVGVAHTLYSGGAVSGGIRAAESNDRAERELHTTIRQQLGLQVHEAFADVLMAKELIAVRRASLALLEDHLAETLRRREQEQVSEFEVLRAEVEVANHRPLLIAAEHQLGRAQDALTRLLGLELADPVDVVGTLEVQPWAGDVAAAVETALAQRPEIRAARAREAVAEASLDVATAGGKPNVVLFADLLGTSPEYFIADDRALAFDAVAGVMLRVPLFDGFRTRGRVGQAQARVRRAEISATDVKQQVVLEVREAYRRLREAEAVVAAQARTVEQAERALAIAGVRYQNGLGTQLEVTDAQVALEEARVVRLRAVRDHVVARAALRRAMGDPLLPAGERQ